MPLANISTIITDHQKRQREEAEAHAIREGKPLPAVREGFAPPAPSVEYEEMHQPAPQVLQRENFSRPIHEEIKDRQLKIHQAKANLSTAEAASVDNRPVLPQGAWVLFNIAHRYQYPASRIAGFRILGFFESREEAEQWIQDHYVKTNAKGERVPKNFIAGHHVFCSPAGELIPLCVSFKKQQDKEYCTNILSEVTTLYDNTLAKGDAEFKANLETRKMGVVGESIYGQRKRKGKFAARREAVITELHKKRTQNMEKATLKIPQSVRVMGQDSAVMIKMFDIRKESRQQKQDQEHVVCFLRGCKDEATSELLARAIGPAHFPRLVIDHSVPMYEYLFPETDDPAKSKENYGKGALNDIMQGQKDAKAEVRAFEEYCRKHKLKNPIIEVGKGKDEAPKVAPTSIDELLKNAPIPPDALKVTSLDAPPPRPDGQEAMAPVAGPQPPLSQPAPANILSDLSAAELRALEEEFDAQVAAP